MIKIEDVYENLQSDSGNIDTVQARVVEAITDWCEALHGSISLNDAVAQLVRGLGAEAGMLVRTNLNENRPIKISVHDELSSKSCLPLHSEYGDELFGGSLKKSRAATLWLASMHADPNAEDMADEYANWKTGRRMQDFAVMILSSRASTRDHLELHFREHLSPSVYSALGAVLPAMARTWASRQVGLITRTVINHRISLMSQPQQNSDQPILGCSNPAQLSRAEFRVCLLLSRGLSVTGVCAELSLADATVRTHLRNIYAKSETSSLAELIFRLIGHNQSQSEVYAISA